jgi:hypothetical protein
MNKQEKINGLIDAIRIIETSREMIREYDDYTDEEIDQIISTIQETINEL